MLLFKDEHKIRQKHEEFLNECMGITSIKLIVYREDETLYSYTSKINYMSEIYETHPKYGQLLNFCKETNTNEFFGPSEQPAFF